MELSLYLKEGEQFRVLKVPLYVIRDLLRDRLSKGELDRINRFAEKTIVLGKFKSGSVVVDFSKRKAFCYNAKLNLPDLEPTWNVELEKVTLGNY